MPGLNYSLKEIRPCSGLKLHMDEACLYVASSANNLLTLWTQSDECEKCIFHPWANVIPKGNVTLLVETRYPQQVYFVDNGKEWCHTTYTFVEYGKYAWNISSAGCSNIEVINKPPNPYQPILGVILILLLTTILWNLGRYILNSEWFTRIRQKNGPLAELKNDLESSSPTDGPDLMQSKLLPAVTRQKNRVVSLDTFRGITISIMIFVNSGGGQYWFFQHSVWNGVTVADMAFPWFLWIMGVSLVISFHSQMKSSLRRQQLFMRVLRRSVVLIALGVMLSSFRRGRKAYLRYIRLPGVLQRIGLCYFMVGIIEILFMKPPGSFQYGRWPVVQDVLDSWPQWLTVLGLTATHVLLTFLLPVPGCPTGYLGPGGLHRSLLEPTNRTVGNLSKCIGGAAGYIDRLVFGDHILQWPGSDSLYKPEVSMEPQGLLGSLTCVLLVYLGVQAGRVMLTYQYTFSKVARWLVWAVITGLIAGILCNFSKNEGVIPMNKPLMSLSFVLALASMAFLLQSILYFLIDAKHWWCGGPFQYAGMNSILLFIGHILASKVFPWYWSPYYKTHTEYIAIALWATTLWLIIAYCLFKKNVFLTI